MTPQPPIDTPNEPTVGHAEYKSPEIRTIGYVDVSPVIKPDEFNALLVEKLREENRKLKAELAKANQATCTYRDLWIGKRRGKNENAKQAFRKLHEAWLDAGSRGDMNAAMDLLAESLSINPITLQDV